MSQKYTCPMHPNVVRDFPGLCPECGMQLVPTTKKTTHHDCSSGGDKLSDKHAGHKTESFLFKFWVVLFLTIPLVVYSELPEIFLGFSAPAIPFLSWLLVVLGSIVYFYGGLIFLRGAVVEIRSRLPGMMTLIALAITAAYAWSVYAVLVGEMPLFWELGTLVAIMLLGHFIEMKAVKGARGALRELAKLLPAEAEVKRDGGTETISVENLKVGDVVIIKPGAKIPADGEIVAGNSELNESVITGESKLVAKGIGDEVVAGTINGDGGLEVKVTKIGEDTFLAEVMRLVASAEASKSRLQILSDRAALWLTALALSAGAITLIAWLLVGADATFAVARLVAVLVIACPHALGLAVPLVASISTNMAASNGFIIKKRLALESARNVDIVLFDKTGTLTKGEFGVSQVLSFTGLSENELLQLAASINQYSEHSIARAITAFATDKGLSLQAVNNFQRLPGRGAWGEIAGVNFTVGSEVLLTEKGLPVDKKTKDQISSLAVGGQTVILVMNDKEVLGAISLMDVIRPESKEAISLLHSLGVKTAMLTGDSAEVAEFVARELGMDEYLARVLPEEKALRVSEFQARGLKIAMVGDGVNDAPALTTADLGIAIGAGTNVALESAGIVLVKNDPRDIAKIIHLSKLTYSKMIQNLFWASGYNVLALPVAGGALFYWGIVLEPAVAAIFMSASTVIVAFNAMLLKRREL